MLSYILSIFFRFCMLFTVLAGIGGITAQLMQEPLRIRTGKGAYLLLGEPGLKVSALRTNSNETAAPDTTVSYSFRDSSGMVTASGTYKAGDAAGMQTLQELRKMKRGAQLFADTTISIIGQRPIADVRLHRDGVYNIIDSSENSMAVAKAALRKMTLEQYRPVNTIVQEYEVKEGLRIMPAGKLQKAGFLVFDLLRFGCFAFLFLCLARLFRNFSKKEFFTPVNVGLLKRTGWMLLLPSIAAGIMYWLFLRNIRPVKLVFDKNGEQVQSSWDIIASSEAQYIILGLGLIVLAFIFNNAFKMKEDNDLLI